MAVIKGRRRVPAATNGTLTARVDRVFAKVSQPFNVGKWDTVGPVKKPWVTYAQGEVFHWNVFGSDALGWIDLKPPNNEPLVLTLGLQKTNHTERNHTESGLLVHLLNTYCKGTCPPFILVAKEQPHAWGIWNEFFLSIQQYIQAYDLQRPGNVGIMPSNENYDNDCIEADRMLVQITLKVFQARHGFFTKRRRVAIWRGFHMCSSCRFLLKAKFTPTHMGIAWKVWILYIESSQQSYPVAKQRAKRDVVSIEDPCTTKQCLKQCLLSMHNKESNPLECSHSPSALHPTSTNVVFWDFLLSFFATQQLLLTTGAKSRRLLKKTWTHRGPDPMGESWLQKLFFRQKKDDPKNTTWIRWKELVNSSEKSCFKSWILLENSWTFLFVAWVKRTLRFLETN